jgi:hypothetical protein
MRLHAQRDINLIKIGDELNYSCNLTLEKEKKMKTKLVLIATIISFMLIAILYPICVQVNIRRHFSEHPITPSFSFPIDTTKELKPISTINLTSIQEISLLPQSDMGVVIALSEGQDPNILFGVYRNGVFAQWDAKSKRIIKSQSLFFELPSEEPSSENFPIYQLNASINFDTDGTYLIVPNEPNSKDIPSKYSIWNTFSMESSIIFSYTKNHVLYPSEGIEFSASSKTVSIGYNLFELDGGGGVLIIRDDKEPNFTRISVDPAGDYLAVTDEKGNLLLGDVSMIKKSSPVEIFPEFSRNKIAYYHILGYSGKYIPTIDLKFDPTHSWLAWLTDEKLVVWSLRNYIFPLHMYIELKDANVMSFDRTGQILAVATEDGIRIFDVAEKKQIAEYQVGEVTALYFSRDNRLLIWGDAQGTIHLWGVK